MLDLNKIIDISGWAKHFLIDKPLNKRAKIDTGKFCNRSCFFCYYYKELDSKDFLTPFNAGLLAGYLLDKGIREIELSGGEPTVHPKIEQIVGTIKEEFQKRNLPPKISIVSNGSFNREKLELLSDINEWLISIHGEEVVHDDIVGKTNSYKRIVENIDYMLNSKSINTIIRLNFVVTTVDAKLLDPKAKDGAVVSNLTENISRILKEYLKKGIQINLLPLNFWKDAIDLSATTPDKTTYGLGEDRHLKRIYESINNFVMDVKELEILQPKVNNRLLNIRYPQFCLLINSAKKYARGHYDHLVDVTDWNKLYYPKDYAPEQKVLSADLLHFDPRQIYTTKEFTIDNLIEVAKIDRLQSHYKDTICKNCKDFARCDGVKRGTQGLKKVREAYTK